MVISIGFYDRTVEVIAHLRDRPSILTSEIPQCQPIRVAGHAKLNSYKTAGSKWSRQRDIKRVVITDRSDTDYLSTSSDVDYVEKDALRTTTC